MASFRCDWFATTIRGAKEATGTAAMDVSSSANHEDATTSSNCVSTATTGDDRYSCSDKVMRYNCIGLAMMVTC